MIPILRNTAFPIKNMGPVRGVDQLNKKCVESLKLENPLLIMNGGGGALGNSFIKKAVELGFKAVVFTRKIKTDNDFIKFVKTPQDITDPNQWNDALGCRADGTNQVLFLNMIGGAVAPEGQTLDDINLKPAVAFASLAANAHKKGQKVALSQISSIAASILTDHSYGEAKNRADQEVVKMDIPGIRILRPGFVFNDKMEAGIINNDHAYSFDQLASLPIQPILGSGDQAQQTVYVGDLATAALNLDREEEGEIIEAVGPDVMTQKELIEFFVKLRNGTVRIVRIPFPLAEYVSQHFPKGRVAPYSIAMTKHLDKKSHYFSQEPFEKAVGAPLKSITEIYQKEDNQPTILSYPPVIEHVGEIASKIITNPSHIIGLAGALGKSMVETKKKEN